MGCYSLERLCFLPLQHSRMSTGRFRVRCPPARAVGLGHIFGGTPTAKDNRVRAANAVVNTLRPTSRLRDADSTRLFHLRAAADARMQDEYLLALCRLVPNGEM